MKKLFFLLLLSSPVLADNTYYEFGPSVTRQTQKDYSDVKMGEVGRVHEGKTFVFHYGIGGWLDNSHWQGSKSGLYTSAMIGWEPQFDHIYVNYSFGPSFLYPTDSVLAGNFQVAQELGFGVKDYRKVRVGIALKHFSDGDMVLPNAGRNFFVIRVQN